jgi:hypothetical protein
MFFSIYQGSIDVGLAARPITRISLVPPELLPASARSITTIGRFRHEALLRHTKAGPFYHAQMVRLCPLSHARRYRPEGF